MTEYIICLLFNFALIYFTNKMIGSSKVTPVTGKMKLGTTILFSMMYIMGTMFIIGWLFLEATQILEKNPLWQKLSRYYEKH